MKFLILQLYILSHLLLSSLKKMSYNKIESILRKKLTQEYATQLG